MQVQRRHRLVGGDERLLEFARDRQRPVEEERILLRDALAPDLGHATRMHEPRHLDAVADDDAVAPCRRVAEGEADELVDLLEIRRGRRRPGEHQGNFGSAFSSRSRMPSRYRISSAVPTPPGNTTMPWAMRTNASRRFSMSGMITRWLTIGFGDSAAMIPGSVMPM